LHDITLLSDLKSFDRRRRDAALRFLLNDPALRAAAHAKTRRYDRRDGRYAAIFEEAFADAIIDFYEGIDQYDPEKSAIRSTIVRFTRINFYTTYRTEQRLEQRNKNAVAFTGIMQNPDTAFVEKDRYSKALEVLAQIGESCKTLLLMWYEHFSFDEMARSLGRPSPDAAKQATYKCREKLNNFLAAHPDIIQRF
jgi:RNA polymerase sigma factor (sigma-70 family)